MKLLPASAMLCYAMLCLADVKRPLASAELVVWSTEPRSNERTSIEDQTRPCAAHHPAPCDSNITTPDTSCATLYLWIHR